MNLSARNTTLSIALGAALGLTGTLGQAEQMEETTVTGEAATLAMPVVRKQGREIRRVTVSYADLRLESPAGINTLYGRIETAARTVCGTPSHQQGRLTSTHRDWQGCLEGAMDGAVANVNHRGLSQYHLAQTGRTVGLEEQVADR